MLCSVLSCVTAIQSAKAYLVTFTNATAITFPAGIPTPVPYPSTIAVSNLVGQIRGVTVTLNNISHAVPDDLDVLLAGPNNESVLLMSDAGGSNAISNVNLTFADVRGVLPDTSRILSGTYQPSNYDTSTDVFLSPAPHGPYSDALSLFDGASPNGNWRLFVRDDTSGIVGSIGGGWRITFDVLGPLSIIEQPQPQMVAPGENVIFRVAVGATPPIHYQWRLNGATLPGQTNSTLTLSNVQAASGGNFSVVVFNDDDAVTSESALLLVQAATEPVAANNFVDRPTSGARSGIVQGDSRAATADLGQPLVLPGGKSVWFQWTAPLNGIVTFTTRGSGFDTFLAVFSGTQLGSLVPLTRDDDLGGFYTSTVQFNALARRTYQIAIDAFSFGAPGGDYTMSWNLIPVSESVPVIVVPPFSQSVVPSSNAVFEVVTDSAQNTYQWLFNDQAIPGATGSSHTVVDAQSEDVGFYSVRVTSVSSLSVTSPPAALQLSSVPDVFVYDKMEDLFASIPPEEPQQMFFADAMVMPNGNRPAAGFISIGLGGKVFTNEFYSTGESQVSDPNPCNSPFVGTLWLGFKATNDGAIQVHTIGSQILARMAVYKLTGQVSDFSSTSIVCDLTSGPIEGKPCNKVFTAEKGTKYTAVVEGWQGTGNLKLTTRMGIAPPITTPAECVWLPLGGNHLLQMPGTSWIPAPRCQWRFNGEDIPNATNTTFAISDFNPLMAGMYSVVMSNFVDKVTNTVARVQQLGAPTLAYQLFIYNQAPAFLVVGSASEPFALEAATSPGGTWSPVRTNQNNCRALRYTNSNILLDPKRFFRAVHWSPPP